jgi:phage terminase small subunit
MEPPAYLLCETVPEPPRWLSDIGPAEWMEKAEELRAREALTTVCLSRLVV